MKDAVKIKIERNTSKDIHVSFMDREAVQDLKFDYINQYLKELITTRGTTMVIDMNGVHFIDNEIIDILNMLYRLGKKYNSKLIMKAVEPEVFEMISLAKKYYVFDVQHIEVISLS